MKKGLAFVAGLMLVCVSGCASDPRDELVNHTISLLNTTKTKVENIREEVEKAIAKFEKEPQKGLDLKESNRTCDELKLHVKELQETEARIRERVYSHALNEEQRKELLNKHRERIEDGILKLDAETKTLNQKVAALEKMAQDPASEAVFKEFRTKLSEAQAGFEGLARQAAK